MTQTYDQKKLEEFVAKLKTTLETICPNLCIAKNLKEHLVLTENQEILMQNPLLIKKRNMCQNLDEKMEALQKLLEEN